MRPDPWCIRRWRVRRDDGELTLVGIISTVAFDLTCNGLVPLPALHELLENPAQYTYDMTLEATTHSTRQRYPLVISKRDCSTQPHEWVTAIRSPCRTVLRHGRRPCPDHIGVLCSSAIVNDISATTSTLAATLVNGHVNGP